MSKEASSVEDTVARSAMKLALEALEDLGMKHFESTGEVLHKEVFDVLKEALAKQEGQSNFCPNCEALSRELKAIKQEQGEPVAWMHKRSGRLIVHKPYGSIDEWDALYTTPQPKQEQDEPVAWMMHNSSGDEISITESNLRNHQPTFVQELWKGATPLYTTPRTKQEPVAWRHDMGEENGGWEYFEEASCPDCQPLYTTPQQPSATSRTWVGLTDEEVKKIAYNSIEVKVAKAIEAKLKEKNT